MSNWREKTCGTIALRAALEGGQPRLDVDTLRQVSERMSCGGMYVPGWQKRFFDSTTTAEERRAKVLHLVGKEESGTSLLIVADVRDARMATDRTQWQEVMQAHQMNAENVLTELDSLWNKYQN